MQDQKTIEKDTGQSATTKEDRAEQIQSKIRHNKTGHRPKLARIEPDTAIETIKARSETT